MLFSQHTYKCQIASYFTKCAWQKRVHFKFKFYRLLGNPKRVVHFTLNLNSIKKKKENIF